MRSIAGQVEAANSNGTLLDRRDLPLPPIYRLQDYVTLVAPCKRTGFNIIPISYKGRLGQFGQVWIGFDAGSSRHLEYNTQECVVEQHVPVFFDELPENRGFPDVTMMTLIVIPHTIPPLLLSALYARIGIFFHRCANCTKKTQSTRPEDYPTVSRILSQFIEAEAAPLKNLTRLGSARGSGHKFMLKC